MTFNITKLTGQRVLVSGQDILGTDGRTVLDSQQWDEINAHSKFLDASDQFDAEVEAFFAPINEAADKLAAAQVGPAEDPLAFVVLHEGEEGVDAKPEVRIKLTHDSVVLRILESSDTSRLLWVGDTLEVTEAPVQVRTPSSYAGADEATATGQE